MSERTIVVVGAGVGGLATSMLLARAGHRVTLLEKDGDPLPAAARDAQAGWLRPGVPQKSIIHAFVGLGRKIFRERMPDVFTDLINAGATDIDYRSLMPGGPEKLLPGDDDLALLAGNRPLLEWVLRRAAERQSGVRLLPGVTATGLAFHEGDGLPRVAGVLLSSGAAVPCDLVVDAAGRRSPMPDWLSAGGVALPEDERAPCGVSMYTRYFRLKPGADYPPGSWLTGPRGELPSLIFYTHFQDNRMFSLTFAMANAEPGLKRVQRPDRFLALAQAIHPFRPWLEASVPATPAVGVMGGLQNVLRRFLVDGAPAVLGYAAVGDSRCGTNPHYGWGMSIATSQGAALVDALAKEPTDEAARCVAYESAVTPATEEWYRASAAEDRVRMKGWHNEPIDDGDADEREAVLVRTLLAPSMFRDDLCFRAFVRRHALFDLPRVALRDESVCARARGLEKKVPPPATALSKDEMVALLSA